MREAYRVARAFGYPHPALLMRQLSWRQWRRLLASFRYDPPLETTLPHALYTLIALTANVNRDSKAQPEPYDATDFQPDWDGTRAAAADADAERARLYFLAGFGALGLTVRDERPATADDAPADPAAP